MSAREIIVDGHVLGEEDFDYWVRRIEDGGRDGDGEVDDVGESDLDRQRSLALYHLGETVLVRCIRSKWHSGSITKIGDEGVRLWVDLAQSTVYVPLPLVSTHLRRVPSPAPSQPEQQGLTYTGGCLSPSASSCSSESITPVARAALEASAPTVVKLPVHAVRPSHLSHR